MTDLDGAGGCTYRRLFRQCDRIITEIGGMQGGTGSKKRAKVRGNLKSHAKVGNNAGSVIGR